MLYGPVSPYGARLAAAMWRCLVTLGLAGFVLTSHASLRIDALVMTAAKSVTENVAPQTLIAAPVAVPLPALDMAKTRLADDGGARQIGVARAVGPLAHVAQTQALLAWRQLPSGQQVAALQLAPTGAHGLRMGVQFAALPAQALLRLYSSPQAAASVSVTGIALLERLPKDPASGAITWWTPDVGPAPVLEILLPGDVPASSLQFSIPLSSEITVPRAQWLRESDMLSKRRSNDCQQDANCQAALVDVRDAVIRMVYVNDAKTFQCTGTLLNNPRQDQTPYVLTAAHCAKDQITASTLQTSWFFYSQACSSTQTNTGNAERYNGAKWLASSLGNDMTLLQLLDEPPVGAVFAGWDSGSMAPGQAVAGLHHPRGDLLMINKGALKDTVSCQVDYGQHTLWCAPEAQSDGGFHRMVVDSGSIEPGSSGSALFAGSRVVGTLTGGDSWCPAKGAQVVYGRLDQAVGQAFSPWLGAGGMVGGGNLLPVYRFHIPKSGADFYTISAEERDAVLAQLVGTVNYVGIAFEALAHSAPGAQPVYRFFNPTIVAHFYTASDTERDFVQTQVPQLHYERIAWWVPAQTYEGTRPLFRFYRYSTGAHFYTLDAVQRDQLRSNPDFLYDGLAYYVWAAP